MAIARHTRGFTVIELLIGMVVTSIILSAVATLAFALTTASTASGDTAATQTRLRQATLRIRELVGACKLLCDAPGNDVVIWRADDNPPDNQINVNELVYLERGDACNTLRLCRFSSSDNPAVLLSDLATLKSQFVSSCNPTYTPLIPVCRDVQFDFYPVEPPQAKCLAISFTLTEDGRAHRYEMVTALRAQAGHLLNSAGDALVATEDD